MADNRRNPRVAAKAPVTVDGGGKGETENLSPSGVYFLIGGEGVEVGKNIHFTISFGATGPGEGKLNMECVGRVVRVEQEGDKTGVAVQIQESQLTRST